MGMIGKASDRPPWRRRYALFLWFVLLVAIGLLRAVNRYLVDVANDLPSLFTPKLIEELTGSLSFGVFLPIVFTTLRRIRPISSATMRLIAHAGLFAGLSIAHTTLMLVSRYLCFSLAGLPRFRYDATVWRYVMEIPTQLFFYVFIVLGLWLFDQYRAGKARELRAAQLESALSEARLEALRLQLNPHFLFNTLNAVSELMYDRPRAADEMLARIGDLLRATLSASAQEHRLVDEWRLLALYLDIQRARFGQGLDATITADGSLDDIRVPFLILQPLVENAIEYGAVAQERRVAIDAVRDGDRLLLRVRDFGDGSVAAEGGHGIGLSNVGSRLGHLYGERAGVRLEPAVGGGTIVSVWLPSQGGVTA